jgi:hypothetical protein
LLSGPASKFYMANHTAAWPPATLATYNATGWWLYQQDPNTSGVSLACTADVHVSFLLVYLCTCCGEYLALDIFDMCGTSCHDSCCAADSTYAMHYAQRYYPSRVFFFTVLFIRVLSAASLHLGVA